MRVESHLWSSSTLIFLATKVLWQKDGMAWLNQEDRVKDKAAPTRTFVVDPQLAVPRADSLKPLMVAITNWRPKEDAIQIKTNCDACYNSQENVSFVRQGKQVHMPSLRHTWWKKRPMFETQLCPLPTVPPWTLWGSHLEEIIIPLIQNNSMKNKVDDAVFQETPATEICFWALETL